MPRRHRPVEGITIHHCLGLDPRDVTVFRGIPTTTVARMLVDLSATHTEYQVAYVINRAAWRHRFDLEATLRARARANGHPGTGVLARAIELYLAGSAGTRSDLEDRFLELVADFPEPLVNMEHLGYELDFHWPDRKLVVEVDGNHTRPNDKRNDAARDRVLRDAGYTVLRFTAPGAPKRPDPAQPVLLIGSVPHVRPSSRTRVYWRCRWIVVSQWPGTRAMVSPTRAWTPVTRPCSSPANW